MQKSQLKQLKEDLTTYSWSVRLPPNKELWSQSQLHSLQQPAIVWSCVKKPRGGINWKTFGGASMESVLALQPAVPGSILCVPENNSMLQILIDSPA